MTSIHRRGRLLSALALCAVAISGLAGTPAQAAAQSLDQSWGGADLDAQRTTHGPGFSVAWDVSMTVTLRDKLADRKCVYVEYKILTARGTDSDSTIAKACNRETVTRSVTRVVGGRTGMATPDAVEFKMCQAVWGTDPCQKTVIRF